MTPEPTDDEVQLMAAQCPLILGAYRTGDPQVVTKTLEVHPPSRCPHVRKAAGETPGTARPTREGLA